MIKTGTIFTGDSGKVSSEDYPSNHSAEPTSEQVDKESEQQKQAIAQLENLAQDKNPVLLSLSTVFPFEFFPTDLTVEKTKVNIRRTIFLGASDIKSMMISDIATVESESSLFFGTLRITQTMPPQPPILIRYLKKSEASRARRIIQGLIVSSKNKVDVTKVASENLIPELERLGDSKI